jgi:NAD(P)-dependent dehydrogenase (short-subunit alcohol dehydrogenase family)
MEANMSSEKMMRLDGLSALVTGGGGALGRHVVKRFLEAGARVHVPVFEPEEKEELGDFLGDGAAAVQFHSDADLTDPGTVSRIMGAIEGPERPGPDILLNLAGGFAMMPVEETSPDDWHRMLDMNATTAFLCSRGAFPAMRARGRGRIVNVSALPALEGGDAGMAAYAAAKAAVLNLTRTLSREGVEHRITVNAVLPSIIDTPANRKAMPEADTSAWIPPSEIAAICHFLATDQARVLTGAALTLRLD